MCRCVPEGRRSGGKFSAEWLNDAGRVVHPAAPLGVGGSGSFRSPGVFSSDGAGELLPHPRSPAVKTVDPSLVRQAEELEAAKAVRQPAPKVTADIVETIRGITVTVKKDASGAAGIEGAVTDFSNSLSGKASYQVDAKNKITVSNTLKWSVEIQTRYGTGTPEGDSEYGRGTTDDDKDTGNVSLGFHESCHRNDFLNYFRTTATPQLGATNEQSETEVKAEIAKYMDAWTDYFAKPKKLTVQQTDEVGDPTLSQADAALAE